MRSIRWFSLSVLLAALLVNGREAAAQPWVSCSISTTSMSFGMYDVFSGASLPTTGAIFYSCNWHARIQVTLSRGGYAPNNNPRQMANGDSRLDYNLYLDAAHTLIWGDPSPNHYNRSGWFISGSLTVYGLIPAGQDVPAGIYSDSVTATVNF